MHDSDPILTFRDAFDSIEPATSQCAAWTDQVRIALQSRAARDGFNTAIANERIPWQVLIASGLAACIAVAAFIGVLAAQSSGPESSLQLAGRRAVDQAVALADPSLHTDLSSPANDPRMEMDLPATGIDWHAHWKEFTTIVHFAFGDADQRSS